MRIEGSENTLVLDDFNQPPSLEFTQRPSFCDSNSVANLSLSILVMDIEPLHLFYNLAELCVRDTVARFNHCGLLHFRRDDLSDPFFTQTSIVRSFGCRGIFAHDVYLTLGAVAVCFCVSIVSKRPISRRSVRN
jgi:hypothetical protein